MKVTQILFTDAMVRAILDGRKTQTRRVVKPQPAGAWAAPGKTACPKGRPGDLLYVREAFCPRSNGSLKLEQIQRPFYRATGDKLPPGWGWKPNIHMPRWASRLTLRITEVRVERLHDISEADKIAEGGTAERPFGTVWKKINTKPGVRWEDNPWVWVIGFETIHQNVDAVLAGKGEA